MESPNPISNPKTSPVARISRNLDPMDVYSPKNHGRAASSSPAASQSPSCELKTGPDAGISRHMDPLEMYNSPKSQGLEGQAASSSPAAASPAASSAPKTSPDAKISRKVDAVGVNHYSPKSQGRAESSSPTAVTDERFLLPEPTVSSDQTEKKESQFLPIIPVEIQQQAIKGYVFVQGFVYEKQQNFVLDRKAVTTLILTFLASVIGFIGVAIASLVGILVVSCPLWLPVAILTLPLWLPLMLFTSPVWLTATATLIICTLCTCGFVLAAAFFFTWPEEWLPSKESSDAIAWYLRQRDAATMGLAKLQAKFLLYAAGVGPAADAVFAIMDKVDFQALLHKLQRVDWNDLGRKVKRGEMEGVKKIIFEIAGSLIQG